MKKKRFWKGFTAAFTLAAVVYAIRSRQSHGTFLSVPYEFRMPTVARFRERFWNPDDPRVFTPRVFGVGWSINLFTLREKFRRRPIEGPQHEEGVALTGPDE